MSHKKKNILDQIIFEPKEYDKCLESSVIHATELQHLCQIFWEVKELKKELNKKRNKKNKELQNKFNKLQDDFDKLYLFLQKYGILPIIK